MNVVFSVGLVFGFVELLFIIVALNVDFIIVAAVVSVVVAAVVAVAASITVGESLNKVPLGVDKLLRVSVGAAVVVLVVGVVVVFVEMAVGIVIVACVIFGVVACVIAGGSVVVCVVDTVSDVGNAEEFPATGALSPGGLDSIESTLIPN